MARSIPALNCSPLPPARQKRLVDALDEDAAILHRLDAVRDLDKLVRGGIMNASDISVGSD